MNRHEQVAKSRLGRLLVNRGYISEDQLSLALQTQVEEGRLLGEVLVSQGLISEKDLQRTLKHQKRYRYTAAFVALAATPFQPMMALAASPIGLPLTSPNKSELSVSDMGSLGGLKMLDDEELSGVSAKGFVPGMSMGMQMHADAATAGLHHRYRDDEDFEERDEEQIAYELADTVMTMAGLGPISNLIEADVSIEGVEYQANRAPIEITEDGKMKIYMPTNIAKISMEDIRVKGNTEGPTMGSIYMTDISYHPDSSYTISVRQ